MGNGDDPALATEAPTTSPSVTTEPTATPSTESPAATESAGQEAAPQTPAEPDYDSLLSNEDFISKVLTHKKAQERIKSVRDADIERRAQERAEELVRQRETRVRAEAESRLKRADEERHDDDLWRLVEEDPMSLLAQRLRPELEARKSARQAAATEQEVLQRLTPRIQEHVEIVANQRLIAMFSDFIAQDPSLSDEDRRELDPRNPQYTDHTSFLTAWRKLSTDRESKELAKTLAKTEAEAMIQAERSTARKQEQTPVTLPPGEGGMSDEQFLADYASGKSNDTARHLKWMRQNGIL